MSSTAETLMSRSPAGPSWVPWPARRVAGIEGGVSTRCGGSSRGALAALNLGSRVGDDPDRLDANLRALSAAAGVDLPRAARIRLEHGAVVRVVRRGGIAGAGDALVTTQSDLPLALTVADCFPLFLAAEHAAIALVHCGWRGILEGIAGAAVAALTDTARTRPADTHAWIGPGIHPCCFTLGPGDAQRFPPSAQRPARAPAAGQLAIDLPRVLSAQLRDAGLRSTRIAVCPLCTACHPELFYSHRRDQGRTGRMLAWIVRREV